MDGKKIDAAIVDEVAGPDAPVIDEKWLKLLNKLAKHPKNKNLFLFPEEVKLLTSKLRDITGQLLGTMQFIEKYTPLMKQIAEVETSVQAAGNAEGQSDNPIDSGDRQVDGSDHGVDPEDLHNTLTPE